MIGTSFWVKREIPRLCKALTALNRFYDLHARLLFKVWRYELVLIVKNPAKDASGSQDAGTSGTLPYKQFT